MMNKHSLFIKIRAFVLLFMFWAFTIPVMAQQGANQNMEGQQEQGTYCVNGFDPLNGTPCTKGFDPDNITCTDSSDGQNKKLSAIIGWVVEGSCTWASTSTPWFGNPGVDTQKGSGIIPGGSGAALGQTATMTVNDGPHFTTKYYNAPSAPNTTATSGITSSSTGANLRAQHNEFGFEVVVDKKTDPLEPYYLKFYIPYTTVDSTQIQTTGGMTGDATGIYSKEVTEMDPNNPGVFNRYTITGTYTSTGSSYTNTGSSCQTGCTSDNEGQWRSQWP